MVYILLAPGFEEAEALVPADLLRRANIETALVSIQGDTVTGSHGITVTADALLEKIDLSKAEMIVLPGGGTGVKNLGAEPAVERLVRQAAPPPPSWAAGACWRAERPSATRDWRSSLPGRRSRRLQER